MEDQTIIWLFWGLIFPLCGFIALIKIYGRENIIKILKEK